MLKEQEAIVLEGNLNNGITSFIWEVTPFDEEFITGDTPLDVLHEAKRRVEKGKCLGLYTKVRKNTSWWRAPMYKSSVIQRIYILGDIAIFVTERSIYKYDFMGDCKITWVGSLND